MQHAAHQNCFIRCTIEVRFQKRQVMVKIPPTRAGNSVVQRLDLFTWRPVNGLDSALHKKCSSLHYAHLTNGFLHQVLYKYGRNTYLTSVYRVTPNKKGQVFRNDLLRCLHL